MELCYNNNKKVKPGSGAQENTRQYRGARQTLFAWGQLFKATIIDKFVGTHVKTPKIFETHSHILTKPPPSPHNSVDIATIAILLATCNNIVSGERGI